MERGILSHRLILVGCEHNHVVERTLFHRYAFSRKHNAHEISRVVAGNAVAGGFAGVCTRRWLLTSRLARVSGLAPNIVISST